ncbi:stage III sporulation protein AF [Clostridium scatologenes]|uniref:Stage III sporulation protein AF n=1 Tax=Clostridium scatologenes TaxID=1548 RepID=A0A0E3MA47_CLOSL|nr:stage III sporulation protein AF [Clostridium scatologenes]AKA70200.1 stage III sporulation protein AF [Clostridium scatologenes]
MIQSLKSWIITICTAVFFITAVEIILPNNSLKKYAKFVLGLILITVFINPIIKLFDKNFDINTYTSNAAQCIDNNSKFNDDFNKYKEKSINSTLEAFKLNLQDSCEKKLKEKYPDSNYKVQVDASYDKEKEKVEIKDINVGIKEGTVEKIKKIKIGTSSKVVNNQDSVNDEKSLNITTYLSKELNVSKDIIKVHKL